MSELGWIHTIFGIVALVSGLVVTVQRKGTRWHRTIGHIYFTSMISLNLTALSIYNLYGNFGPFHWLALASLITLFAGLIPVLTRSPKGKWLERHAIFINYSYIGLVAAFAAEITSRIPDTDDSFGIIVAATSVLVMFLGSSILWRFLPHSLSKVKN